MIPKPPRLSELSSGAILVAGAGHSTIIPDFDFETYSPAGFIWNVTTNRFDPPHGATKRGLSTVGAAVYAEHPETEILSCAYDLKDGRGRQLWQPGNNGIEPLLEHVRMGGILEAWNSMFEYLIWNNVGFKRYGWPILPLNQLRCAMSKARSFGLPGSLAAAGDILGCDARKDREGKRLLDKFSIPRNPTKKDLRRRILLKDDAIDAAKLLAYNERDIEVEAEISSKIPDLIPQELEFWLCDQAINARGVAVDTASVSNCIEIIEQAYARYNDELTRITNGEVKKASEVARLIRWLASKKVYTENLDEEALDFLLSGDLPEDVRRALIIRKTVGSAAVKKLYAMINTTTKKGRIHDLFVYHSARTGRAAGMGVQPQNLPNSGEMVSLCNCGRYSAINTKGCPWCGSIATRDQKEWNPIAVEHALEVITARNLDCLEYFFGNAVATISGCLRGMFIASPGHDLICSDYSAIEAVVLAAIAGEDWQTEVFRTHGKIYEMTASRLTGIPFEEFELYKGTSGQHHPKRKLGKVASLASGYGSWLGGWKALGADKILNDEEIKIAILAWRDASPNIVNLWHRLEECAINAVLNPGIHFSHRGITYFVNQNVLYCQLLSGRRIVYHDPQLYPSERNPSKSQLSFEGWNTNPKYGAIGWVRLSTYGGKLTENVVQATARDILAHAIVNLEKAGYPVVLHVHDEIVVEISESACRNSISEVEKIMSTMPTWAKNWPIRAQGGWRAKRYAK